jgi:hypothetical protein
MYVCMHKLVFFLFDFVLNVAVHEQIHEIIKMLRTLFSVTDRLLRLKVAIL